MCFEGKVGKNVRPLKNRERIRDHANVETLRDVRDLPPPLSPAHHSSGGLFWTSNLGINATLQEKRKTFLGQRNRVNEFFY